MLEGCVWYLSCLCLFGLKNCPRQKPQSSLASAAFLCNNRHAQWAAMYTLKAWHLQLCLLLHCCCMYNDKSDAKDVHTIATVFKPKAAARKVQDLRLEFSKTHINLSVPHAKKTNHSRWVQLRQTGRLPCQHQTLAVLMFNAQVLCNTRQTNYMTEATKLFTTTLRRFDGVWSLRTLCTLCGLSCMACMMIR